MSVRKNSSITASAVVLMAMPSILSWNMNAWSFLRPLKSWRRP
ncbi:Uncharacterised protein [Vibrio cholerae]|nr:Uncharacterised protein [Vibrio cholerae]